LRAGADELGRLDLLGAALRDARLRPERPARAGTLLRLTPADGAHDHGPAAAPSAAADGGHDHHVEHHDHVVDVHDHHDGALIDAE